MSQPTDEAIGADGAHAPRWALGYRQFDLVRAEGGETYLTRWWLVKTPFGGIALHRMTAPDARPTMHDHPFTFVSIPLVGGYMEQRLVPREYRTIRRAVAARGGGHRVNVVRAGIDAHTITELFRVPTWTLLLIGRHRRTWGFLEPHGPEGRVFGTVWRWTKHDAYDSGHYAS